MLAGADTGGTFTDVVAIVDGRLHVRKVRSTPHDPALAVRRALDTLAAGRAVRLHYGSTVATNALLERRGARVVLLTTEGFEDVLEIGRQARPELYDLAPVRPAPVVARADRIGVPERVLVDGTVARPLTEAAVRRAVAAVRRRRADAVAVCLLHAYAQPRHERLLGRALRSLGLHVTLSHELLREYREYERVSTTVVNAYVGPLMATHLGRLARAARGGLRVMQSSGGLIGARFAAAEPVRTILSGPAGGVVGAAARARAGGLVRVITLDMGGTSTDVAVVDGPLGFRTETSIDGLPVRVPVLDIHTVGAGGGSIARLDAGGALRVGPESAGADPGPACYGTGRLPTVTDANLVLGRLVETEFLGGEMSLDLDRARRALAPLARRLGGSVEAAAMGVVEVANAAMERAVRVLTVERGLDPRDFTLLAFGGAGALHAAALARALGTPRVYVPRDPGLLSAWGMLRAEVVRDLAITVRLVEPREGALRASLQRLEARARRALRGEGIGRPTLERSLDVRYAGQSYEVTVPFTRRWRETFHERHAQLFGHADPSRFLEVVTVRVRARGGAEPLPPVRRRPGTRRPRGVPRRVFFTGRWSKAPVYRRDDLASGWTSCGPLIVCEYSATTVVPPGWRVRADRVGGLVMEVSRA
jgi:N-methylhydantoinase A